MFGQDMKQGYIKMEITEVEVENKEMQMMVDMMKGTETEYYFTDEKSLIKANMMGGMMTMNTVIDNSDESMTLFFDAMGNKMQVESTKEDRDASSEEGNPFESAEIKYIEDDTKEILGHKCVKTVISSDDMDGMEMVMYVARDIKASPKMIQGLDGLELEGFPLEYIMNAQGMKMTYTTIEMEDKVDKEVFNVSSNGYKKMSWDEFQETMGGMGGFGG